MEEHIANLSLNDSWLKSDERKKLADKAATLLEKDELNPCDIEAINNEIPDEHQDEFWEDVMGFFDSL